MKNWDLSFANWRKLAEDLKIGEDIVYRHLKTGDSVLFNRQPSLHRISIMCHKAKIMENRTLRFNECVCTPYNADFDGDEMNIHVPQTEEARAECNVLMNVVKNIQTPKNGDPLISANQDFITASYLITQKDQFFDRGEFFWNCAYFGDGLEQIDIPPPAIIKPVELWTGKQLMSLLLKPNRKSKIIVNIEVKETNYTNWEEMCNKDKYVRFKNSELISGNLGKKSLGTKNGLYYSLLWDHSHEISAECMLWLSKFTSRWISNYGMSIGINDVTPS